MVSHGVKLLVFYLQKKLKMIKLVDCSENYWEFIRLLRTDERNSNWFFTQPTITVEQQTEFMLKNSEKYKVCTLDNNPVGYIGLIGDNEITYCVSPDFKGKGVGTFMVNEFIQLHDELIAYVIPQNIASCKVFEKLNFEKQIFYKYKKK
jgi:RimJ/RimL family protein N-acetyltransferase